MDFAGILHRFYPFDVLSEHLLEPETFTSSDSVFQDAVAVVLALLGYSTVVLGKKGYSKPANKKKTYDVIRLQSGYEAGSADIVAYKDKKSFLVDCTMSRG